MVAMAPMTTQSVLLSITNLGDLAVLLPITLVLFIWLLSRPLRLKAVWWAAAVSLCIGGTALLKVIFFVCPPFADLQSPSGHTNLSTLVYGALAMIIAA